MANQLEMIQKITETAVDISHLGIAHVFVEYSGHVNRLHVRAHPVSTDYLKPDQMIYLFDIEVSLQRGSQQSVLESLTNVYQQLTILRETGKGPTLYKTVVQASFEVTVQDDGFTDLKDLTMDAVREQLPSSLSFDADIELLDDPKPVIRSLKEQSISTLEQT